MRRTALLIVALLLFFSTGVLAEGVEWRGTITGYEVNLRSGPDLDTPVIGKLRQGQIVTVLETQKIWYKIRLDDQHEGWVHHQFISAINIGTERDSSQIVSRARGYMGTRYIYGGGSVSGFDCSGYTMYVFRQLGIELPHNAAAQMNHGAPVSQEALFPGDLVFFSTMGASYVNHVGIYIGEGQFIHASSGYGAVRISPLNEGYYLTRYRGARRLIPTVTEIP